MFSIVKALFLMNRVSNTSIAVAQAGNTELLELIVDDISFVGLSIAVTGQDLDTFVVQGRMHQDDSYQTLYSAAGSYTTPTGLIVGASGDLTTLAAAANGWLLLNVLPLYSVKFLASSGNVAGSTVTVRQSDPA